jgi:hypothetical protein
MTDDSRQRRCRLKGRGKEREGKVGVAIQLFPKIREKGEFDEEAARGSRRCILFFCPRTASILFYRGVKLSLSGRGACLLLAR